LLQRLLQPAAQPVAAMPAQPAAQTVEVVPPRAGPMLAAARKTQPAPKPAAAPAALATAQRAN
ncbi:MAG: hypothetical protein M3145_05175, partial [Pseudomonadota bacterium]|nr:hypothetical protein [Pseudomonadota bacterium]